MAAEKARLEEERAALEGLGRRRIEVLQRRKEAGKELEAEEQKRHTRVMLLIDAISKFKEAIDVGAAMGEGRRTTSCGSTPRRNGCKVFLSAMFVSTMIDLRDVKFMYSREEVQAYLQANAGTVEDLLRVLIEAVFCVRSALFFLDQAQGACPHFPLSGRSGRVYAKWADLSGNQHGV